MKYVLQSLAMVLLAAGSFFLLGPVAGQEATDGVFRPEPGKFPPLEKAHAYRGELVFVRCV